MKILIISSYYKPFNNASSLDIQKKIGILKKISTKIDIVTIFEKNSLEYEKYDNLNIYRIKNIYKNYSANINLYEINKKKKIIMKLKSFFKEKIIENLLIPDSHVFWIGAAYNFIKKNLDLKEYDFVITMSQTNSSHLVGLKLKEKNNFIKWITYWNDPWFANLKRYNKIREKIEKKLENKVIKISDGFMLFCDELKEKLIDEYMISEKKIFEINGFYNKYKQDKQDKQDKLIKIVHTGDIYLPIRDLFPFIEALKKANKIDEDYINKVIFIFVGKIRDEKYLSELKKIQNVRIEGEKTYEECNEIIKTSDILLLFGNKGVKRLPSKVFDYISYSKPIITILGDTEEPLFKFFKLNKRGPILENKTEDVKNILLKVFEEFKIWNNSYIFELSEYREDNVKEKLKKWLEELK